MPRIEPDDLIEVLGHLRTVLAAGLPLPEGLRSLAGRSASAARRPLVEELASDLETGMSLTDALERRYPGTSPFTLALLRSGETGGDLPASIEALLDYHRSCRKLARRFLFATLYPRLVIAILVLFVLPAMAWALHRLSSVGFGGELLDPAAPLQALERGRVKEFLLTAPLLVLWPFRFGLPVWILAAAAVWFVVIRPVAPLRWAISWLLRRLLVIGPTVRHMLAAQFTTALGLLVRAGVPVERAVSLIAGFSDDPYVRTQMQDLTERLARGQRLSEALADRIVFPRSTAWFASLGERGNRLDESLLEAGRYHRSEAEYQLEVLNQIVEPAMLTLIALLLFPVLSSVVTPLVKGFSDL
jgi:type IV pilus assembly protein PilC